MSISPVYVSTTFTSPYGDAFTAGATIYWDSNFYVTVTDFWCDGLSDSEWTWRLTGSYSSGDANIYASENSGRYSFQGVKGKTYVWGACAAVNNIQAHYWTNTNGIFTLGSSSSSGDDSGGSSGGGSSGGDEEGWDDEAPDFLLVTRTEGVSVKIYKASTQDGPYVDISNNYTIKGNYYKYGIYWNTYFKFGIIPHDGYVINYDKTTVSGMMRTDSDEDVWYFDGTGGIGDSNDTTYATLYVSATSGPGDLANGDDDEHYLWVKQDGVSATVYTYSYYYKQYNVRNHEVEYINNDGLWYGYDISNYPTIKFDITALPGYTLNETTISGLNHFSSNDPSIGDHWYLGVGDDNVGESLVIANVTKEGYGGDSGNTGSGDSGSTTTTPKIKIYIDNGSEFVEHYAYIDNGSSWEPVGGGSSGSTGVTVQKKQSSFSHTDSKTVNCGFKPDYVAFTLGEYEGQYQLSTAAVFVDGFSTKASLSMWSEEYKDDCYIYVSQTSDGFDFYACYSEGDTEVPWEDTFYYLAVKYT